MSILKDLYYGNINPSERYIKRGSEYQKLSRLLSENEDKLLASLDEDGKRLYESILEGRYQQEDIAETETFVEGFRLGAQIMLEILTEPEKQLLPA